MRAAETSGRSSRSTFEEMRSSPSYAATLLAAILSIVGCSPPWSDGGKEAAEKARAAISRALHTPGTAPLLPAASNHPEDREQLGRFYQSRGYAPAWTEDGFR